MNIHSIDYKPYISPARVTARQKSRDAWEEAHKEICSDSIRDINGFYGDDYGWCIYLKELRKNSLGTP